MPKRRSYTRFKLESEGRLLLEDRRITISCWDVSGRGLGGVSHEPLDVNSKVKAEFFVPWLKEELSKDGKVVWCNHISRDYYRFGIEFAYL